MVTLAMLRVMPTQKTAMMALVTMETTVSTVLKVSEAAKELLVTKAKKDLTEVLVILELVDSKDRSEKKALADQTAQLACQVKMVLMVHLVKTVFKGPKE